MRHEEPAATVLLGPEQAGSFVHEGRRYPFTLTLKRALGAELNLRGDERTNGLDVSADELARRMVARSGRGGSEEARQAAKRELIHRYGSDIHRSFLSA